MWQALEDNYFRWLCAKVEYVPNPTPSLTHRKLLRILHSTEFVWVVSGDDNRAADGVELRNEFMFEARPLIPRPVIHDPVGCSMLEMLIAFSRRAEFVTDDRAHDWFWRFIENLRLSDFNDAADIDPADVEEILDAFIWRTYAHNGQGGLFPIKTRHTDQRDIELWYQFAEYIR